MGKAGKSKSDLLLLKDPDDLLDKYLRLKEENSLLKQHNCEQEDKIKQLATRLVRITNDLKKRYDQENGGKTKGAKVRNFADEEEISRLNEEVREWKRKCEQLKNKNDYLAQLVPANKGGKGKRRPSSARAATASRMQPPPPPAEGAPQPLQQAFTQPAPVAPAAPSHDFQVHHEMSSQVTGDVMGQNNTLQMQVLQLQSDLAQARHQAQHHLDKATEAEKAKAEAEAQVDKLTTSMGHRPRRGSTAGTGNSIYTDEDYMALQREMRVKTVDLTSIQTKYESLYANEQRMVKEVEAKVSELKTERDTCNELQREVAKLNMKAQQSDAYKTQYELERESRESVEQQLKNLTKKIFNVDKDSASATAKLRTDADDERKKRACTWLTVIAMQWEKRQLRRAVWHLWWNIGKLCKTTREAEQELEGSKKEQNRMEQELLLLQQDGQIDTAQMLDLLGKDKKPSGGKERELKKQLQEKTEDYKAMIDESKRLQGIIATHEELREVWEGEKKGLEDEIRELKESLADAKLRKRDADSRQTSASEKDSEETVGLKKQLAQARQDLEAKDLEISRLKGNLDLAEAALKAGGGQSTAANAYTPTAAASSTAAARDSPRAAVPGRQIKPTEFNGGENVLELSIMSASLDLEKLEELGLTDQLASFLLIDFASHQPTTTKLVTGISPAFDLDIEFAVDVNAFFLELLTTEPIIAEMYVRGGTNLTDAQSAVATARLYLVDLIKRPDKRILATADLMTVAARDQVATTLGTLQFSVGLRRSIAEVAARFREVAAADLQATLNLPLAAANPMDKKAKFGVNIMGCTGLRQLPNGQKPSPCVAYQFFNFPPCDTEAVVSSTAPEFDDTRYYEVARDEHLTRYLKNNELDVAVFDDSGIAPDAMLGSALVPLADLAYGEKLSGSYDILDAKGEKAGQLNLEIYWVMPDPPRGQFTGPDGGASSGSGPGRGAGNGLVGSRAYSDSSLAGRGSGSGAGPLRDELGMEWEEEGSFLGQTAELDCTVDDLDASVEWGMSSLELRAMGNNR